MSVLTTSPEPRLVAFLTVGAARILFDQRRGAEHVGGNGAILYHDGYVDLPG